MSFPHQRRSIQIRPMYKASLMRGETGKIKKSYLSDFAITLSLWRLKFLIYVLELSCSGQVLRN